MAVALREAARRALYAQFYRGPVLGGKDEVPTKPAKKRKRSDSTSSSTSDVNIGTKWKNLAATATAAAEPTPNNLDDKAARRAARAEHKAARAARRVAEKRDRKRAKAERRAAKAVPRDGAAEEGSPETSLEDVSEADVGNRAKRRRRHKSGHDATTNGDRALSLQ